MRPRASRDLERSLRKVGDGSLHVEKKGDRVWRVGQPVAHHRNGTAPKIHPPPLLHLERYSMSCILSLSRERMYFYSRERGMPSLDLMYVHVRAYLE